MEKEMIITAADSLLCANRGRLKASQEARLEELIVVAREAEEDEPLPLELVRLYKVLLLRVRDHGPEVCVFTLGGQPMWIAPYDRANLRNAADAKAEAGISYVDFLGQHLPTAMAQDALRQVERYAADCTTVTDEHEAAILALDNADAVLAYDITTGYPEKLAF